MQDDPTKKPLSEAATVVQIGTIELREEVLSLVKGQLQTGQVSFNRKVETRTETVTTELRRETLVITVRPGTAQVYLGEELLQPGEAREVLLYDESATVVKTPMVTEEVHIGKRVVTEQRRQQIDLQYEVLVVDEHPATPGHTEPGHGKPS
ncbi:YsnF/AvaK domain-containing protein [Deinococcus sp.]|uniref:YsnF/AvaK domain-containing protein n=1 Tax=Deinococcus sp. TaxID=47478 RepID=UPI003C7C6FDE